MQISAAVCELLPLTMNKYQQWHNMDADVVAMLAPYIATSIQEILMSHYQCMTGVHWAKDVGSHLSVQH